jgi:hypothetical protein
MTTIDEGETGLIINITCNGLLISQNLSKAFQCQKEKKAVRPGVVVLVSSPFI